MLNSVLNVLDIVDQEKRLMNQRKQNINTKIQKIKAIKEYIEQNEHSVNISNTNNSAAY